MSLSMYQASVPVFVRALANLRHVLQKGEAHAKARGVTDAVLLQTRLIPDMLPLVKQVQIACDMACRGAARLAGEEPKSFEDNEATMAEVLDRIDRAIGYVQSFKAERIDGSESRAIQLKMRSGELNLDGQTYLLQFILPNLYFHCATAYNLFRGMGAEIGKTDFLGDL